MKRQISICFFTAGMVILSTLFYIKNHNEMPNTKQSTEESGKSHIQNNTAIESNKEYTNSVFYITSEDGYLCVYETETNNLYFDTGIETTTLPNTIQEKLKKKIYFKTHEELYDFLESYSS